MISRDFMEHGIMAVEGQKQLTNRGIIREPPPPVDFYPSKLKLGVLIIPCLLGVAMTLQTERAGVDVRVSDNRIAEILAEDT